MEEGTALGVWHLVPGYERRRLHHVLLLVLLLLSLLLVLIPLHQLLLAGVNGSLGGGWSQFRLDTHLLLAGVHSLLGVEAGNLKVLVHLHTDTIVIIKEIAYESVVIPGFDRN